MKYAYRKEHKGVRPLFTQQANVYAQPIIPPDLREKPRSPVNSNIGRLWRADMVFHFPLTRFFFVLAIFAFAALLLAFGLLVEAQRTGPIAFGEFFLFGGFAFVTALGVIVLLGQSAVVVNEAGISRSLGGWRWQSIQWQNVGLITAFPVSGGYGYVARAFNVFPAPASPVRLLPFGKMVFTDKVHDALRLTEILNGCAQQHEIRIEVADTLWGERKVATHL